MKFSNQKILVTGGASGIGFAMAEQFIADGNTVIICGRREDALAAAARQLPSLITRRCDLALGAEREQLLHWIQAEHADLGVLVNNSGVQNWMAVTDELFFERAKNELTINIEAPVHLSSLFLQLQKLKAIINVTSGLAFVPFVKAPVYSATKAFFHSFSLSLRAMLKSRQIEVIEIIPPALNTDLGGKVLHDFPPPVGPFIESVFSQMAEGKNEI